MTTWIITFLVGDSYKPLFGYFWRIFHQSKLGEHFWRFYSFDLAPLCFKHGCRENTRYLMISAEIISDDIIRHHQISDDSWWYLTISDDIWRYLLILDDIWSYLMYESCFLQLRKIRIEPTPGLEQRVADWTTATCVFTLSSTHTGSGGALNKHIMQTYFDFANLWRWLILARFWDGKYVDSCFQCFF